jgi:hypothetical protein
MCSLACICVLCLCLAVNFWLLTHPELLISRILLLFTGPARIKTLLLALALQDVGRAVDDFGGWQSLSWHAQHEHVGRQQVACSVCSQAALYRLYCFSYGSRTAAAGLET